MIERGDDLSDSITVFALDAMKNQQIFMIKSGDLKTNGPRNMSMTSRYVTGENVTMSDLSS